MAETTGISHESWQNEHSDASDDEDSLHMDSSELDVVLARPPPAFTVGPQKRWNSPSSSELTPPPSPTRVPSPLSNVSSSGGFPSLLRRTISVGGGKSYSTSRPFLSRDVALQRDARVRAEPKMAKPSFKDFFDLSATSAPAAFGLLSTQSKDEIVYSTAIQPQKDEHLRHVRRASTLQVAANFLGLNTKRIPASIREEDEDPFYSLDIDHELFPGGRPQRLDHGSMDDLAANAERLILRMQAALRLKCDELKELQASKSVEQEELEEARTRASHLKLQLDGMSQRVCEQDEAMKSLVDELVSEKHRRQLEEELRSTSIRRVEDDIHSVQGSLQDVRFFSSESRATMFSLNDTDSDSSEESSADSVFSHTQYPGTPSNASFTTTIDFQRDDLADVSDSNMPRTFAGLREENLTLKARVAELEETVDGCLGLFNNIQL